MNTTILDQNYVNYSINDDQYQLPDFELVNDNMVQQIETIKNNNYLLPDINEINENKKVVQVFVPI